MLIITISSAFWSTKCQLDIKAYMIYTIRIAINMLYLHPKKKKTYYSYPFVQTGTEYINIPNPNEMQMVIKAYAYALQGRSLSLIALNSAMKVETVLRQPKNPSCMPNTTVSQVWLFTCTKWFKIVVMCYACNKRSWRHVIFYMIWEIPMIEFANTYSFLHSR